MPGKLMVAGEFAVLVPNQLLAVTAVDRFVYAEIKEAAKGLLTLEDYQLHDLTWRHEAGEIKVSSSDERLSFVKEAMEVTCNYLSEKGIEVIPFSLAVRSELDDASGVKYGLGSSATVTVAVVTAIMQLHAETEPDKDIIFKLAALAHVNIQKSGSGADIAASVYGGILEYASFQAEWLLAHAEEASSVAEVVDKDWIYLKVKRLTLPSFVSFCVGWTGKPASTTQLVGRILELKEERPDDFAAFLRDSEEAVHQILSGLEEEDIKLLLDGVIANRRALRTVGNRADAPIETARLGRLCDIAEEHGGAGKPSGAGGGDCGIAFMPETANRELLFEAWEKAGIKPLSITSHPEGAKTEKKA